MKQFISYLLGVAMLLVYACAGPAGDIGPAGIQGPTGPTGPQGPEGARLKGDIKGQVTVVYDIDKANPRLTDLSGVTVGVKDGAVDIKVTTDAAGSFTLKDVPTGTYDIMMTKEGFGRHEVNGFKHVGGNTSYVPTNGTHQLIAITKVLVGQLNATFNANKELQVTMVFSNTSGTANSPTAVLYAGRDNKVGPTNYVTFSRGSFFLPSFPITYTQLSWITNFGFKTGERVYLVAYGGIPNNGYFDPKLGKIVATSLNPTPSNVVEIIMP